MKFEGSPANVEKAYDEVSKLVLTLCSKQVQVPQHYELSQLESARAQINPNIYICCSETTPRMSAMLYSFDAGLLDQVVPVVQRLLSMNSIPLECKLEEVVYLKNFQGAYLSTLPVTVNFEGEEKAKLCGGEMEIQSTVARIHAEILDGLLSKKYTFTCNSKFQSRIEQSLLLPRTSEEPTFKYFIPSQARSHGKWHKKSNQTNSEASDAWSVYVFCKDNLFFEQTCQLMQRLKPGSRFIPISHKDGEKIVREMKPDLESKYQVQVYINEKSSSFTIHGLIQAEIQQCQDDIKARMDKCIVVVKYVPVDLQLYKILKTLHESDFLELRKSCAEISLLSPRKDQDSTLIRIKGSISQVEDVKERLSSGLLSMSVYDEKFTIQCPKYQFGMWCKRWSQIRDQEMKRSKVIVEFTKTFDSSENKKLNVNFEVTGTDDDSVQEVMGTIISEGSETEEKKFTLSSSAITCLFEAKRDKKLDFLINNHIVFVTDINKQAHTVTLLTPKGLSDGLDSAEESIMKFAGERARASHVICSKDPVVGLILSSSTRSIPYVTKANFLAKNQGASVHVQKKPSVGLRISGTESTISVVKSLLQEHVIEAIESTVGQKTMSVKSLYNPFLTTSNFAKFQSKLENDFCVVCSLPKISKVSKVIASSLLQVPMSDSYIKVEVCKGDLVHEQVDAIVNASNEDLKHIGGLAKAILDAGGPTIQSESDEYTRTNGKVRPGKAVCLGSGDLPCQKVIHAIGPRWVNGSCGEEKELYSSVYESLAAASKESLVSIAFPAISTGVFNVPVDICARASLKAVKDFCQSTPNTSLQNVKFVLYSKDTVSAFKPLLVSGTCGQYQYPHLPAIPVVASGSATPRVSNWQWLNDQGSFSYYSSEESAKLASDFQSDPKRSYQITINGVLYTIDFARMVQINSKTGYSRRISQVTEQLGVQWLYKDDAGTYLPYGTAESRAIESMCQTKTPQPLVINGKTYTFDFSQMCQMNVATQFKRPIERRNPSSVSIPISVCADSSKDVVEAEDAAVPKDIVLTLRGPVENLLIAEARIVSKLEGAMKTQVIESLPKNMSTDLEKKIDRISRKNNIMCSFEKKQKGRVLKLEGIYFKVQAAVGAIQEEILTFTVNSASSEEEVAIPPEWQAQSKVTELFSVAQGSSEWQRVTGKFNSTMGSSVVHSITRIQNTWIWKKYAFQKKRVETKNGGRVNEMELFHGTRQNDPRVIYEGEDGFDMRYGRNGMWGVANYFAVNASYSNGYAYNSGNGRQMFLVKVLTGDTYTCAPNGSLRMPPEKPSTTSGGVQVAQMKYDTVSGTTGGSQVFMTYDNDKAYPAYLITYN
jgi:O-acetyl-ADP-ribose deacetylase (regulator of RNase III)